MYIAVVADNAAERKNLERLLSRSIENVSIPSVEIYVESYGNVDAAMQTPMKYSLYILDFSENPSDFTIMLDRLHAEPTTPMIAMCLPSDIPTEETSDDFQFLKKPLEQSAIEKLLVTLVQFEKDSYVPRIEIRSKERTYYKTADEIIYAEAGKGTNTIHFTDGTFVLHYGEFSELADAVLFDEPFVYYDKYIVNSNYVTSLVRNKLTLENGEQITLPLSFLAKNIISELKQ